MNWRKSQSESRSHYLACYNTAEVEAYERWCEQLTSDDDEACLRDIATAFQFKRGVKVLDVGAGTGAMCRTLLSVGGLNLSALEPAPAMIAKLKSKPELRDVEVTAGFCDSHEDRQIFGAATFDVIVSRQLVNGLFDPLSAFRNWMYWLQPGGTVIVLDGLYDRSAWTGNLVLLVDTLPMSACKTTAMAPYLMENAGFRIEHVGPMQATNARPTTRTPRYMVVASKTP